MEQTALSIHVLIVDDNVINRILLNKVLSKWGATSDYAENGLEAVKKIEDNRNYDVVLMDIYMPEMTGIEATRVLRGKEGAYFRELPIIALTASMLNTEMNEIEIAGMNGYVSKPFEPAVLFEKLSHYQKV
jgi:CheY-like chemotaxis protein